MTTHWISTRLRVAGDPDDVADLLRRRAGTLLRLALELQPAAPEPIPLEVFVDDGAESRMVTVLVRTRPVDQTGPWLRLPLRWDAAPPGSLPAFDGALEYDVAGDYAGELSAFGSCAGGEEEPVSRADLDAVHATARRLVRALATEIGRVLPPLEPRPGPAMAVRDVMTPDPVTVREDTPILLAALVLLRQQIGGVPVVDHTGQVVGVLSESDLLAREATPTEPAASGAREEDERRRARTAGDACGRPPLTVAPDTDLPRAARTMLDHDVSRLVVEDAGRLVGVLSRRDVLKALTRIPAELQHRVDEAVDAAGGRDVRGDALSGGTVRLRGRVAGRADEERVVAAVRALPGVSKIVADIDVVGPTAATTTTRT